MTPPRAFPEQSTEGRIVAAYCALVARGRILPIISDITTEARIARNTFYDEFASAEELRKIALGRSMEALFAEVEKGRDSVLRWVWNNPGQVAMIAWAPTIDDAQLWAAFDRAAALLPMPEAHALATVGGAYHLASMRIKAGVRADADLVELVADFIALCEDSHVPTRDIGLAAR